MSFADWVRTPSVAATPATVATHVWQRTSTVATVATIAGSDETADYWLIMQAPVQSERWFSPPISRAELAQRYPGAALVAIPQHAGSRGIRAHEDDLRRMVAIVASAKGFSAADHAGALTNTLEHPAEALTSLRAMMRELGIFEERAAGSDTVRLHVVLKDETGFAIDFPEGGFDGLRILELLEKHMAANTTRVVRIDQARMPGPVRPPSHATE